ncbi:MAG: FAD:protein FMN transferase [Candidatus Nanopelagicales bacterium]
MGTTRGREDLRTVQHTFSSMATTVEIQICNPYPSKSDAIDHIEQVFARVEAACTRFDPNSPLMRANNRPADWHVVPDECLEAIAAAANAHHITGGLFDPRVLTSLVANGYDSTLPFRTGGVQLHARSSPPPPLDIENAWSPDIDVARRAVRLGDHPIDLGGIGKSYAVMRVASFFTGTDTSFLINAGGDCYAEGTGPAGDGWLIGVEDPASESDPLAVLRVVGGGCATSSTRLRRWQVDGRDTHHLVDPRSGRAGGHGLTAVTVIAKDTMAAETWTKALFLSGPKEIAAYAEVHQLAALWVDTSGRVGVSPQMVPHIEWCP